MKLVGEEKESVLVNDIVFDKFVKKERMRLCEINTFCLNTLYRKGEKHKIYRQTSRDI